MTTDGTKRQRKSRRKWWAVELDEAKCSLCEVCPRHCPTGAIRLERAEDTIALYFDQSKCNGCNGEKNCEAICPEEAITVTELDAPPDRREEVLLIQSTLVRCSYCHEYFSPYKKLESLEKKGLHHEVEKSLCPLCRRTNIVVKHIDEKLVPGEHAEYRSTKDILRRAKSKRVQADDESSS